MDVQRHIRKYLRADVINAGPDAYLVARVDEIHGVVQVCAARGHRARVVVGPALRDEPHGRLRRRSERERKRGGEEDQQMTAGAQSSLLPRATLTQRFPLRAEAAYD